jgi:hypothetical protein
VTDESKPIERRIETKTRLVELVRITAETVLNLTEIDAPSALLGLETRTQIAVAQAGVIDGLRMAFQVLYPDDATTLGFITHHQSRAQHAVQTARTAVEDRKETEFRELMASIAQMNAKLGELEAKQNG